jgi:hypothetical protein
MFKYELCFCRKNGSLIKHRMTLSRNMPIANGDIIVIDRDGVGFEGTPAEISRSAWKVRSMVHLPENHSGGGPTYVFTTPVRKPAGI